MGTVILVGVLIDQQWGAFRERRRTQELARKGAVEQPAE
jgi:ribose transport system permease protein